jgi:type IV pilus assembly protein PilE
VIELMIVVAIVAVLTALAYPSYTKYARKAKRGEAQQLLMNWAINQEIWRSNHPQYASTGDLAAPTNDYYLLSTDGTPTATAYVLQAVAQGGQADDESRDGSVSCRTLSLNQSGVKSPPECWE